MANIVTCIDGSNLADAVSDAGIWVSQRLSAPLQMLHVLDKGEPHSSANLSGNIVPEGRRKLLKELVNLEEKHAKLALEAGKHMLEDARQRAADQGIEHVAITQRHGTLSESLIDISDDMTMVVIGQRGESQRSKKLAIGSQIESVIRTSRKPILIVPENFTKPTRFLIAYDGREVTEKAIDELISSALLKSLDCHIISVKNNNKERQPALDKAAEKLTNAGFDVRAEVVEGNIQTALNTYIQEHSIELLVMGAYGHSRLHQLFVGSHTTNMVRQSDIPVLIAK
ncbi:MAG: universal stress protein [Pseudomonadales bacterium]|nr:universal stress protein [Pseudomonadales bacterium]